MQVGVTIAAVVVLAVAAVAHHTLGHLWIRLVGAYPVVTYPLGVFDPLTTLRPWIPTIAIAAAAVVVAWILSAVRPRFAVPSVVRQRLGPSVGRLEPAGIALAVIAVLCLVVGGAAELGVYRNAVVTRSLVTPADLTVLRTLSARYPPTTIVMTDGGNDAGMWMAALTDLRPLVPNGFEYGALSLPLDVALVDACGNPGAAEAAVRHADVIFLGAHMIPSPIYPWKFSCIAALPNLRLITSSPWEGGTAAAFAVIK